MQSQPSFVFYAIRDVLLLFMAVLVWVLFVKYSAGSGALADFSGLLIGVLLAVVAHLLHEWGHLLGGLAGKSVMVPGGKFTSLSLFVYSSTENTKQQFMLMSFSGFAMTAVVVWIAFAVLPGDYLATHIVRGFSMVQVFLAVFIELPLVIWAAFGKRLPPVDKKVIDVLSSFSW